MQRILQKYGFLTNSFQTTHSHIFSLLIFLCCGGIDMRFRLTFIWFSTNILLIFCLGDQRIMFADYVDKINKHSKIQKRGIVVTEQNIYKHDPKRFKLRKVAVPIAKITDIW
jgi:hypothetical protein